MCKLSDRPAERIDWLGVSFGITKDLFKFWKKHEFVPFYLRQTCNDLTGEHTCIMIKDMQNGQWPGLFSADFKKRFMALLGYQFNSLSPILGLSVLESSAQVATGVMTTTADVHAVFSPYDLKRLSSYAHNLLDYHVILDLVPLVSKVVFNKSLGITVSALQAAILVSMGLQHATLETTAEKVGIAVSQILALFAKCIKKVSNCLNSIVNNSEASQIELEQMEKTGSKQANLKEIEEKFAPVEMTLEQDQAQDKDIKQVMKDTINSLPLETYAITSGFDDSIPVNLDKSAIIAVRNDDSTKKNKRKQGVADTLIGTRQSIVDPKGVLEKIKQKKRKLQVKKDKKQMNQKMA